MRTKNIVIISIVGTALASAGFFLCFKYFQKSETKNPASGNDLIVSLGEDLEVDKEEEKDIPVSPVSGIRSENGNRRPFAVMLAGDENTRPLSGIGMADLVVEMPVIKNGINRFMAVFVTENPDDIGSVRSARHDFIPLARGLNAIFVHWGGSHFALEQLNREAVDNLDALPNLFSAFYRKKGVVQPNNGFTSMERMTGAAMQLKYSLVNDDKPSNIIEEKEWNPELDGWKYSGEDIVINYPGKFGVIWKFNKEEKLYYRFRGGTPEMDKLTGKQVAAKVVAIIKVFSKNLEGQYNEVDIEGTGELSLRQQGFALEGKWSKEKTNQASPMKFLTKNGFEAGLLPGKRWWEVVDK